VTPGLAIRDPRVVRLDHLLGIRRSAGRVSEQHLELGNGTDSTAQDHGGHPQHSIQWLRIAVRGVATSPGLRRRRRTGWVLTVLTIAFTPIVGRTSPGSVALALLSARGFDGRRSARRARRGIPNELIDCVRAAGLSEAGAQRQNTAQKGY
jgi:hypothetical protein